MKKIIQNAAVFAFGGLCYGGIELLWRQNTHWSMLLAGGLCFLLMYKIFNRYPYIPLYTKCFIGSVLITAVEFVTGCAVNILGGMRVWDYSFLPMNFMGQICLLYSVLWGFLTIPAFYLIKYINYLFNRGKPAGKVES